MGKFERMNQRAMDRNHGSYQERRRRDAEVHGIEWQTATWTDDGLIIVDELASDRHLNKKARQAEKQRQRQLKMERRQEQREMADLETFGMF